MSSPPFGSPSQTPSVKSISTDRSPGGASTPAPEDAHEVRLLSRVAAGEHAALDELYHRYATPLFSFIYQIIGNRDDAAEVLQETFLRVWKKAASYDCLRSRPFSWVVMMARGLCLDKLRRRSARSRSLERLMQLSDEENADPGVVENLFFAERGNRIREAMAVLSEADRRCIELSFFSDAPHSEIAETLGMPLGTVKSRVRRGLARLKTILLDLKEKI